MTAEVFPRSPLAERGDDLRRVGAREVPFVTQLAVRARTPGTLALPTEPNTWSHLDPVRQALWLGPDEWLVVGRPNTGTGVEGPPWRGFGFADPLADGLDDADAIVDVSANRAVIELRSDDARDRRAVLEQGCSLDLDPIAWHQGRCAQTLLGRVPVLLQEREDATRVFVRPSYASWLVDWFVAVAT